MPGMHIWVSSAVERSTVRQLRSLQTAVVVCMVAPCSLTSRSCWASELSQLWHNLQQITGCVRPCRPAIVAGVQLVVEDEVELRKTWDVYHHFCLPAQVAYSSRYDAYTGWLSCSEAVWAGSKNQDILRTALTQQQMADQPAPTV